MMTPKGSNVILIGMPGSGKSTVGVALARELGYDFLDSDRAIEAQMGKKLSQLLDEHGDEGFRRIEEDVNASLDVERTVIATGGSVIYGPRAMEHLKTLGTVVYLQLPCRLLAQRLGDLHARGVTIAPGMTLQDLYNERCPLYEKWADVTIPCQNQRLRSTVTAIADIIRKG